jgi:hypothetical protein
VSDLDTARNRARREAKVYGSSIDANPYKILLDEVKWRAGHVEYLRQRIAEVDAFEDLFDGGFTNEDGQTFPTLDGALLRRYDKERELLDRVCGIAIRMGIAEKYVQLAQMHGQVLFEALRKAFDDPTVQLTADQRVALVESLKRTMVASTNGNGHMNGNGVRSLPPVPTYER